MSILSTVKSNKLKTGLFIAFTLILFFLLFLYSHKVAPISWGLYGQVNTEKGIALLGADTVAYYSERKYIQGNALLSHKTANATWYFSSEANKQLFIADPEKYKPQYGGYCALAVTKGVTTNAAPEHWLVQDGKLYLFFNNDIKTTWLNEVNNGAKLTADGHWARRQ